MQRPGWDCFSAVHPIWHWNDNMCCFSLPFCEKASKIFVKYKGAVSTGIAPLYFMYRSPNLRGEKKTLETSFMICNTCRNML